MHYANLVQVNDVLPPCYPWEASQLVLDVTYDMSPDGLCERVYIHTTRPAIWSCAPTEAVVFPRRLNGEHRDWRDASEPPTPRELALGDFLPALPGSHESDYCILTNVASRNAEDPLQITISLYPVLTGGTPRRFMCYAAQPLVFPLRQIVPEVDRTRPLRGPYADVYSSAIYWLMLHPSGKGRWPAGTPTFRRHESGEHHMRPPTHRAEWEGLKFLGSSVADRHPNDPHVQKIKKRVWYDQHHG